MLCLGLEMELGEVYAQQAWNLGLDPQHFINRAMAFTYNLSIQEINKKLGSSRSFSVSYYTGNQSAAWDI